MTSKQIALSDVFVSVEDHSVFDSPEAIEQISAIRAQLAHAPPGSQCVAVFDQDDEGDLEIRPFVVPPNARIDPSVVAEYKRTPAFKVLMDHLDNEVAFFPDKERTLTALASLLYVSKMNMDLEISAFAAQCMCALLPNVLVLGVCVELHENATSVRDRQVIQISYLQMTS